MIDFEEILWLGGSGIYLINDLCMFEVSKVILYVCYL